MRTTSQRAFSLVELIVVIGIMAVLTGMLLPVVSSVQQSGNQLVCQSNLHQIGVGIMSYTIENKGSMPYGWYWTQSDPVTWAQLPGGDGSFISWATEIDKYVGTGRQRIGRIFRCPSAMQAHPHQLSYVMNFIVAVSPLYELYAGQPPFAQLKPSTVSLMRKEGTALVWDTAVNPGLEDKLGFLVGSDIDDLQMFWRPHFPAKRYFDPSDPMGQLPPGVLSHNNPIAFSTTQFRNIDPSSATTGYPYQGNLRFRHSGQTQCNVLFSDGSVRVFTAVTDANQRIVSHDAIRRLFMTEWPPRVPMQPFPSPTIIGSGVGVPRQIPVLPAPDAIRADRPIPPEE